jgi:hypothetical protein
VPEVDACSSLPKRERGNEDRALLLVVQSGRVDAADGRARS